MTDGNSGYVPEGRRRVGLAQRRIAAKIVQRVLAQGKSLDEQTDPAHGDPLMRHLPPRDRAFIKALTTTLFRRLGSVRTALETLMDKGMPKRAGLFEPVLLTAATQILFMETAAHAAVDQAVILLGEDRHAKRYSGLANAVLRRLAHDREAILAALPADADLPEWLAARWRDAWGEEETAAIAAGLRLEPPLDATPRDPADAAAFAAETGGAVLGHSVRIPHAGAVEKLPGYAAGRFLVQDIAAALPARLLRFAPGARVADLCAAPGGKTAQLALAGGAVTAFDRSQTRLDRLRENMARLGLTAETRRADILRLEPAAAFDAILLDAPCSATGTLRRHPDIAWHRNLDDIVSLAGVQSAMLDRARGLLKPGGCLVYATCSLEPEEGEKQAEAFLARFPDMRRDRVDAEEAGIFSRCVDAAGDIRILPTALDGREPGFAGCDGFFAARFTRLAD
ncbi:MAG: RsmB/NOP family class I SAM-dependent RNA methyltransferase [Flavobacteriaceae bacterium]